jgi:hypothetical protein
LRLFFNHFIRLLNYFLVMSKFIILSTSLIILILFACKSKEAEPTVYDCASVTPKYTTDIKPIFDASCATAGCHSAAAKKGGADLSTYAASKSFADADGHAILGTVQHTEGFSAMPQGGSKLSEDKVKLISCWIQNGAPE